MMTIMMMITVATTTKKHTLAIAPHFPLLFEKIRKIRYWGSEAVPISNFPGSSSFPLTSPKEYFMQTKNSPKRPNPGATTTGVKFLITAASLTAVVGGWAAFSLKEPAPTVTTEQAALVLPPLPTLVARPGYTAQAAPEMDTSSNQPAAPALRSVTMPQPQPSDNSAPPPVTNTRSSR
jgi:hypothetical protein